MIEYKSREVLAKLIYIITISMAVIGVLFIPQIIFSRVKLSKTIEQKQSIEIAKTELVSEESLVASKKVTSRNGEDTRKSSKSSKEEKEDNKNLADNNNEKNKAEVKKEDKKSDASKKENKNAESESKKSEKQETKQKETKKESSKNVAKTSSKKAEKNKESKKEEKNEEKVKATVSSKKVAESKQENNSEENTKKTTEKKDSSEKETTSKKENKKSTTKTVSISQVKISKSMNLTKRTGLSRKDFIKLMSGVKADTSGFFEKNAGKIYDLCEKYSINEIFFCGLISAESGWNIASNHRRTHNYISLMRNGKLISYSSVNEGLEVAAQKLHYNYLTPGGKFYHGKTLAGVKTCFCPSSSWVGLVYGRMRQIL